MGGPRAWSRLPVKLDSHGVPMSSAHILVTVPRNTPLLALDVPSLPLLPPVQPGAGSLDRLGSRQTWTRAGERTSSRVRPLRVPLQRHPWCVLGVPPGMAAYSFSSGRCRERVSVWLYTRLAPVTWPLATCLLDLLTCRHFHLLHSKGPAPEPGWSASPQHTHTHPTPHFLFLAPQALLGWGCQRHGFLVVKGIRSLAHSVPWALSGGPSKQAEPAPLGPPLVGRLSIRPRRATGTPRRGAAGPRREGPAAPG